MNHKIIEQTVQAFGVQRVQVIFTDDVAKEHWRQFDFPSGEDVNKSITDRYPHIEQTLKDQEIAAVSNLIESGGQMPTLDYATEEEVKLYMTDEKTRIETEIADLTIRKDNLGDEIIAEVIAQWQLHFM